MARRIAQVELILITLAAPFLLFPNRWTPAALGLVLLTWLGRAVATGRLTRSTASDLPLAILLGSAVIGFQVSADQEMSRAKLWGIVLQVALFYTVVNSVQSRRATRRAAALLVALTVGVALLSLVGTDWESARLLHLPWLYERLPRLVRGLPGSGVPVASDLFHPREVGATLALLLPIPVALLLFGRDRLLRWLALAALVAAALPFLLSESIQAAAGLAVALALVAAWRWRRARLALPLGIIALAGALYAYGPQRAAPALLSLDHPLGVGVVLRWDIWSRAWAMVRDAPLTGVGLNTFPVIQAHFYPGFLLGAEPHAHQLFLQTAVDLGLPGLLALLWLLAAFACTAVQAYRLTDDRGERVLLVGLAAGVVAYVVHGLVDTVTLGAKPVAALFVMFGLAAAVRLQGQPDNRPRLVPKAGFRKTLKVLSVGVYFLLPLVVCAVAIPATLPLNRGVVLAHQALVEARATHLAPAAPLAAAVGPLQEARARAPQNVYIYEHLGSVHAWLGEYPASVAAIEAQVALDGQRPMDRYAPFETLRRRLAGEAEPDAWDDLLKIYGHWQNRYPDRAEGYLRAAIVWYRYRGDAARARSFLQAGLDNGAEPAGLLVYYMNRIGDGR